MRRSIVCKKDFQYDELITQDNIEFKGLVLELV